MKRVIQSDAPELDFSRSEQMFFDLISMYMRARAAVGIEPSILSPQQNMDMLLEKILAFDAEFSVKKESSDVDAS